MISKSAHSSLVERAGCVSDVPFTCVISTIGSLRILNSAYSLVNGFPKESFKANIKPSDPLELCGIAKLSIPSSLNLSIHFHKPSGSFELALLYGADGIRLPFPLKTTFL